VSNPAEGNFFRLWNWFLPLLLGLTAGWFGMVCLEIWLDGQNLHSRPPVIESSLTPRAQDTGAGSGVKFDAFLRANPFGVTPMREYSLAQSYIPSEDTTSLSINQLIGSGVCGDPRRIHVYTAANNQGIRVEWISDDDVFAQIGVQQGDIVRSIDGIYLSDELAALWRNLVEVPPFMDLRSAIGMLRGESQSMDIRGHTRWSQSSCDIRVENLSRLSRLINFDQIVVEVLRDGVPILLRYVAQ